MSAVLTTLLPSQLLSSSRLRFPSQIMFAPRGVRESPGSYCLIRLALFP